MLTSDSIIKNNTFCFSAALISILIVNSTRIRVLIYYILKSSIIKGIYQNIVCFLKY